MLARIVVVRSVSVVMSMPAGIQRWISGSSVFTRSTVSITLASGCLVMNSSTAGFLLNQPDERVLRTDRSMVAMSASRTGPFDVRITIL